MIPSDAMSGGTAAHRPTGRTPLPPNSDMLDFVRALARANAARDIARLRDSKGSARAHGHLRSLLQR